MSKAIRDQSKLGAVNAAVLETAAKELIKNVWVRFIELKAVLASVKKSKKPMSSKDCRDFLFGIISHPVLFVYDEAKESFGFMSEELISQIQGDRDGEFDPEEYWDPRDNYDFCRLVLKIAERHFKDEYVRGYHVRTNVRYALLSAAKEWLDDAPPDE